MNLYHVNPETGNPNICRAEKGGCPFGGTNEHFESKAEARADYESKMDSATEALQSVQKEMKAKRETKVAVVVNQEELDGAFEDFPKYLLPKAELKTLEDFVAGKKVSDEKLDHFMASNKTLTADTGFNRDEHVVAARYFMETMKAERDSRGTPNTLPTLESFDPATETVFSNAKARANAIIAGRAVRREAANTEWMYELANTAAVVAKSYDPSKETSFTKDQMQNQHDDYIRQAHESEARVQAQLREIQYLYDNDPHYAATANAEVRQVLSKGWFRPKNNYRDGLWIGTVKKAK